MLSDAFIKGAAAACAHFGIDAEKLALARPNPRMKSAPQLGGNFLQQQVQHGKNLFGGVSRMVSGGPGGGQQVMQSLQGLAPSLAAAGGLYLLTRNHDDQQPQAPGLR